MMHDSTLIIAQHSILDSLPVSILIVDEDAIVHYSNQEAKKLFDSDFIESFNITQLSDDLDEHDFKQAINKLNHNSQPLEFNIQIKQSGLFQLSIVINPEQDSSYLITLSPLSLAKEASSYKKNFKELKQFARLGAMREVSSFFADQLNQPLTSILSYTQAMQRLYQNNASSEEIDKAMERVVINAENAGQLIKKIRAKSNINTLNYEYVCINNLIQHTIDLTELSNSSSEIKLTSHYESSFLESCIDKIQIRQVFFSLINNAIDAVNDPSIKEPEITIATHVKDDHYEIIISDNGPGFPEEILDKLYEPFTSTKKNGIGIGLSMCHHIIELHKGSIHIEQPETKVTICLPIQPNEAHYCL